MTKYPFEPKTLLQTDSRWRYADYSAPGESTTVGASGCGPTAACILVNYFGWDDETPLTACKWALSNGYKAKGQGTYYSFFTPYFKRFGIVAKQMNDISLYGNTNASALSKHTQALEELKNGNYLIACMGKSIWTSSGHFIVVYGYSNGKVYIKDPNSTADNRTVADYEVFRNAVKYYFVVKPPTLSIDNCDLTLYINDADGWANIRKAPTTSSNIYCQLNNGNEIYSCDYDDGWYKIVDVSGGISYIYSSCVTTAPPTVETPKKWYTDVVEEMRAEGIVNGDTDPNNDDTEFEAPATKAEVCQMFHNFINSRFIKGGK